MSKDRRDGKYIKPTDAMHAIMPYLMEKRIESEVSKTETLDITNLMAWIDKKMKTWNLSLHFFKH